MDPFGYVIIFLKDPVADPDPPEFETQNTEISY